MARNALTALVGVAGLATVAEAQFSGWQSDQVSTSMCMWESPRAIVIRDTLYVDGGKISWSPQLSDGSYGPVVKDANLPGYMFNLNLGTPFRTTKEENFTTLFQTKSKARGGSGSSNNGAPNYVDGGLLGNDAEFFLYGGLAQKSDAYPDPDEDEVLGYQAFKYGGDRPFSPGFVDERLSQGVTRYVTYGAAVSVPSENKAWYFSGMRSPTSGIIYEQLLGNMSNNAINISDTLISLTFDPKDQSREEWKNTTLPDSVKGRANAEIVFLPVGPNGILVVVGGVTFPAYAYRSHRSENPDQSRSDGEEFMKVVDVYDIAEEKWYKQATKSSETVPARAQGCAVVSYAKDLSSFNIYYYGGSEALETTNAHSDDVWILSIPSFTWVKAKAGNPDHARAGHRCVAPYPDQMMVVGGYTPPPAGGTASSLSCLKDTGIIQMLNLTSLEWMDSYNPDVHGEYGVPQVVQAAIGGGYGGGATVTTPAASGWQDAALGKVFETPYPTSKITVYPYGSATPNSPPNDGKKDGGGVPKWLAPTLGVILGLVFVTALVVAWVLWKRRKYLKRGGTTEGGSDYNGMRILSWIKGQPSEQAKAMTVTTEETATSPEVTETATPMVVPAVPVIREMAEMADTQVWELPDTSRPLELSDTGLTPIDVINKHSHFAVSNSNSGNPSSYSSLAAADQASTVSKASATVGRSTISNEEGVDSPATPNLANTSRITSGVSGISERDVHHLRQISEATVSSTSETGEQQAAARDATGPIALALATSPTSSPSVVSPPTAGGMGDDYLSSRLPVSPKNASPTRKSLFHENADDLGDRR